MARLRWARLLTDPELTWVSRYPALPQAPDLMLADALCSREILPLGSPRSSAGMPGAYTRG